MIHWTASGWRVVPIRIIAKNHISWLTVGWLFGIHFASLLHCASYQDTMLPRKKTKLAYPFIKQDYRRYIERSISVADN